MKNVLDFFKQNVWKGANIYIWENKKHIFWCCNLMIKKNEEKSPKIIIKLLLRNYKSNFR